MDRKSITFVVVVILCAVWFASSRGWIGESRPDAELKSNQVVTEKGIDQSETAHNAQLTKEAAAAADTRSK